MPSLDRKVFCLLTMLAVLTLRLEAKVMEDVIATVNGKPLLLTEYRKNVSSVLENWRRTMPDAVKDEAVVKEIRQKVLDEMINNEILAQEGEKLKLKVHERELEKGIEEVQERSFRLDDTGKRRGDKEMRAVFTAELEKEGLSYEQYGERIRRQILIRKLLDERVRSELKEPEEAKIKAGFEKLKFIVQGDTTVVQGRSEEETQEYLRFGAALKDQHSERVRVSHIVIKTGPTASMMEKNKALERAVELKKRIDAGQDFSELAGKESDDLESAPRGGDLGFILRGWMPAEFEKVAFSLPVGEISDPVETKFGFHLIRVQEKKAKETLNYERLKADIAQFLYGLDFQSHLLQFVKKLRAKATIEVKTPS